MSQLKENTQTKIEVEAKDLPLHCPMPDMVKWNAHPRVYLPIEATGEARCPTAARCTRSRAAQPATITRNTSP
ncbi:zinc-finger domain-containing protein [Chitinimonas koreensis]|uniref:zinc-finger domain-containing protein n=1 Tax=Chitinimonas koreensis TaxID=356302 RepID=UPI00357113AE